MHSFRIDSSLQRQQEMRAQIKPELKREHDKSKFEDDDELSIVSSKRRKFSDGQSEGVETIDLTEE